MADWPEGQCLPAKVVSKIMDTWTPDGSRAHKDGSNLYGQVRRQRSRAVKAERYPLIVVEQHRDDFNEVLYGVEASKAAKRSGIAPVRAYRISEADGLPPRGERHPAAD
jgi:hypothetical protein